MSGLTKAAKHSAPGQYLGFALQPVRFCYHLLTCEKGTKVSLEHLDDVAVHYADGTVCLEQTKSALKTNPLSDWAIDFWKALANWAGAFDDGLLKIGKARFRIYVTPSRKGTFAQALSDATTANEVGAILAGIAKKAAAAKSSPACAEHLKTVLDLAPERQVAIIANMRVESADNDPIDPIRALLAPTVPPELVDLFCAAAIGIAKQNADRLIQLGQPAILDGDAFKVSFRAFVQKNMMPGLLTSLRPAPQQGDIESILSTRPTFIRQLEFIGASDDDRLRAVSDFLRTSADKADWAERGLIFEESLRDWDDDLVKRHGFIAGDVADRYGDRAADARGRLVYRQCALLQAPLEGRAVPGHFVHGCFNTLADTLRIGWHPDFATLLHNEVA
ncbi:ABC-three component system protein [Mesorhizobium sp.]|uniref:ABC-three component system protein n=1 Tax=Mesorhizobium sp. TaxID=1871066 RepID=UPI000FE852E0|nr:ABC-three component system protein [Mesorhizobium sp.]RWI83811.1 MAG: hypothetical protein EOR20_20435 [Mesorhizobium sp.]